MIFIIVLLILNIYFFLLSKNKLLLLRHLAQIIDFLMARNPIQEPTPLNNEYDGEGEDWLLLKQMLLIFYFYKRKNDFVTED